MVVYNIAYKVLCLKSKTYSFLGKLNLKTAKLEFFRTAKRLGDSMGQISC